MNTIGIDLTDEQRNACELLIEAENPAAPLCEMALQLDEENSLTESASARSSSARN